MFGVFIAKDRWGRPVLLFRNSWKLDQLAPNHENGVKSQSSDDADVAALGLVAWSKAPSLNTAGSGKVHLGF